MEELWQPDPGPYLAALKRGWWLLVVLAVVGATGACFAAGGPSAALGRSATHTVTGAFVDRAESTFATGLLESTDLRQRTPEAIVAIIAGQAFRNSLRDQLGFKPRLSVRLETEKSTTDAARTGSTIFVLTSSARTRDEAVRAADAAVEQIKKIRSDDLLAGAADVKAKLVGRKQTLSTQIGDLEKSVSGQASAGSQAAVLELQDLRKQMLDTQGALDELELRSTDPAGVDLLDRSGPAGDSHFAPGKGKILAGTVAGALIGVIALCCVVVLSGRVSSVDDVARRLKLRPLGTLRSHDPEANALAAAAVGHLVGDGSDVTLVAAHDSPLAERAVTLLRAALETSAAASAPPASGASLSRPITVRTASVEELATEAITGATPPPVVLVAQRGVTRRADLAATSEGLTSGGLPPTGVLLVDRP